MVQHVPWRLGAAWRSMEQHGMGRHSSPHAMAWAGAAAHAMASMPAQPSPRFMAWHGTAWHGARAWAWHGMAWHSRLPSCPLPYPAHLHGRVHLQSARGGARVHEPRLVLCHAWRLQGSRHGIFKKNVIASSGVSATQATPPEGSTRASGVHNSAGQLTPGLHPLQ